MTRVNCRTGSDAEPQSLADVIEKKYGGNQSEFARAYGDGRQQVQQWLKAKKPVLVLPDGRIVSVLREPVDKAKK